MIKTVPAVSPVAFVSGNVDVVGSLTDCYISAGSVHVIVRDAATSKCELVLLMNEVKCASKTLQLLNKANLKPESEF